MINIQRFTFNAFMVNTYLLWDETLDAVVIDPACHDREEEKELEDFIQAHHLKLVRCLNTHCHIDHVLGNGFIARKFGIHPEYHPDSDIFFRTITETGLSFGFSIPHVPAPAALLNDEQVVEWGKSSVGVLHTPGHAAGSVCFHSNAGKFVITGDVLFRDTIGRTDLPTGDFDRLMNSIKNRLFTLPEETVVYPGHGPETSIGEEMRNNPFIRW